MKDKINLTFSYNPNIDTEKYLRLINKLTLEGWDFLRTDIVGFDKDGNVNLKRVYFIRNVI